MKILKFIEVPPQYPLPIKIYYKEDYLSWPPLMAKEKGFDVEVATLSLSNQKRIENINGITVRRFPGPLQLYLYLLLQRDAFIHAQGKIAPLFSGFFSSRAVYTTHATMGKNIPKYLSKPHLRLIYKKSLARFQKVIAISSYEVLLLKRYRFKPNFVYIPNAIDCSFFEKPFGEKEFRKRYNLRRSSKIIIFLGNMHQGNKTNIETLFKAFNLILQKYPDSKLIVIGKFPAKIKKLKEYLDIAQSTLLTGWLPHNEFIKAFNIADVFVNTSKYEGDPLSVAEAASAKIPLCLSDIPTLKSIYRNTALYHDPVDYCQLSKNIIAYLQQPSLGKKNALAVHKMIKLSHNIPRVQKFTWQVFEEVMRRKNK